MPQSIPTHPRPLRDDAAIGALHARDYLSSLGALGLTARLKRLTDGLLHEARALYDELGLNLS